MAHVQRSHKDQRTVTQEDSICWDKLRETHPIPQRMPNLPIVYFGKERKRQRPTTPVKTTPPEEIEIIKITKVVTPTRRPIPAPRGSLKRCVMRVAENKYIRTPLVDVKEKELLIKLKCKRSQRNELKKIAAAMDLEIQALAQELKHLQG